MEAVWLNNILKPEELHPFKESEHHEIDESSETEIISNCIFKEDCFEYIHLSPKTKSIIFQNVCFQGEKPEPNKTQRPIQFSFKQPLASVIVKNSLFTVDAYLPYEEIKWRIFSSVANHRIVITAGDTGGCIIKDSKIHSLDLRVSSIASPCIHNSWFNSIKVSGYWDKAESIKHVKSTTWSGLQFYGYVENEFVFTEDTELEEVSIKYDCLDDEIQSFGVIDFRGGTYKNGITIQAKQFSAKEESNSFELGHKTYVSQIDINYNKLNAKAVRVHQSALKVLKLEGNNLSVNNYFENSLINSIQLKNYMQSEKGVTLLKSIPRGLAGNFPLQRGGLLVQDSIISNDQFYIQRCSLANWKTQFTGSSFKYQSLSSDMPESSSSKKLNNRLDDLNTLLRSINKEDNIINWSQIKRNQLELVWKLKAENSSLNLGQKIQWFIQKTNDYGTNWTWPTIWLLGLNFIFALGAISVCHCLTTVPATFGDLIDVWFNLLNPISKQPSDTYWVGIFRTIPYCLKVINAVLIVQIVSAFRVYFKK